MALLPAGSGIYYATSPDEAKRRVLTLDRVKCTRFMDFIYLPVPTHELSQEQVIVVNTLRHRFRRKLDLSENFRVRAIVQSAVLNASPQSVLEFGCGFYPLFSARESFDLVCVDLNEAVVTALRGRGYKAFVFSGHDRLVGVANRTIDVVVAIFVLHFPVSDAQFGEISRALNDNGVFFANVYRRGRGALITLQQQIERAGLFVVVVPDPLGLRREHQFWVAARSSEVAQHFSDTIRSILT